MPDNSPKSSKGTEREFLHDLATSFGAVLFMTEALLDDLKERCPDTASIDRVEEMLGELNKTNELLKGRREYLISSQRRS